MSTLPRMTLIELPLSATSSAACRIGDAGAPITRAPITEAGAGELALVLQALADPVRLRLVSMIAAHEGAEACVCDLTAPLGLSQPTVSHHPKVLTEAGFLTRSKRGTWAHYAVVPGSLHAVARTLTTV